MFDFLKRHNKVDNDITKSDYSDRPYYYVAYKNGSEIVVIGRRFYTAVEAQDYIRANQGDYQMQVIPLLTGDIGKAKRIIVSKWNRVNDTPEAQPVGARESTDSEY